MTFTCVVLIGERNRLVVNDWANKASLPRWPSARPDAIATEETYKIVSQSVVAANVAKKMTDRVPWERGLHQNYTGIVVFHRALGILLTDFSLS